MNQRILHVFVCSLLALVLTILICCPASAFDLDGYEVPSGMNDDCQYNHVSRDRIDEYIMEYLFLQQFDDFYGLVDAWDAWESI